MNEIAEVYFEAFVKGFGSWQTTRCLFHLLCLSQLPIFVLHVFMRHWSRLDLFPGPRYLRYV